LKFFVLASIFCFEKVIGRFQISDSKKVFIKFAVALQKNENHPERGAYFAA